jgi:SAM-dependent methyltransferase
VNGPGPGHGGSPSIAVPDYWWYVARSRLLAAALASYVDGARTALDIGSADGPSAAWFRESAAQTVALDIDPRGLRGDAVCGSALNLPFADNAFDAVAAFDVIEHVEEGQALAEIRRVLRAGGTLVASVPAYQWAWTDFDVANGHLRRYTRRSITAALAGAGFEVHHSTYAFSTVFPAFAAERLLRKVRRRPGQAADIVEVPHLPTVLDAMLRQACRIDELALRRWRLPFGSSVFVAASAPR